MPSEEPVKKKKNKYQLYVEALCHRYANQLASEDVEQSAQDIKPLMGRLVYCAYNLITYLSYQETIEIYNNLLTLNQKDFYKWSYSQYQERVNKNVCETVAQESLLYGLLWRDFQVGNYNAIKEGGTVAPTLLAIANCCLIDEPCDALCDSIYFPVDEADYFSGAGVKCFIANCQKPVVPDPFNEEVFTKMVHEDIQEIIDTMYNLYGKEKDKENAKEGHEDFNRKTPASWIQTYMTPSMAPPKEATSPVEPKKKKVNFDEKSLIRKFTMKLDSKN